MPGKPLSKLRGLVADVLALRAVATRLREQYERPDRPFVGISDGDPGNVYGPHGGVPVVLNERSYAANGLGRICDAQLLLEEACRRLRTAILANRPDRVEEVAAVVAPLDLDRFDFHDDDLTDECDDDPLTAQADDSDFDDSSPDDEDFDNDTDDADSTETE
jgi:hypothetical protein